MSKDLGRDRGRNEHKKKKNHRNGEKKYSRLLAHLFSRILGPKTATGPSTQRVYLWSVGPMMPEVCAKSRLERWYDLAHQTPSFSE